MSIGLQARIEPEFRTIDGLSIRFAESGGRGRAHALLLNPWPESLYAFEPTWSRLAEHAHLIAIDLPGFGHSERRDSLLSPLAMGEFIVRAADAFGLENPHVVGPDIGTSAALFAAAHHPGRFRSITVGTGGAAVPLQLGGILKEWVETTDFEKWRRADPRAIVEHAIGGLERHHLPAFVREDYLASYLGDRFVESLRYVRAYPAQLPVLAELLPTIKTPVQLITGARDAVVPPANAQFLHDRLPNSTLEIIDAGHFVWEDAADEYARLLIQWWRGGYVAVRGTDSRLVEPRDVAFTHYAS